MSGETGGNRSPYFRGNPTFQEFPHANLAQYARCVPHHNSGYSFVEDLDERKKAQHFCEGVFTLQDQKNAWARELRLLYPTATSVRSLSNDDTKELIVKALYKPKKKGSTPETAQGWAQDGWLKKVDDAKKAAAERAVKEDATIAASVKGLGDEGKDVAAVNADELATAAKIFQQELDKTTEVSYLDVQVDQMRRQQQKMAAEQEAMKSSLSELVTLSIEIKKLLTDTSSMVELSKMVKTLETRQANMIEQQKRDSEKLQALERTIMSNHDIVQGTTNTINTVGSLQHRVDGPLPTHPRWKTFRSP